MPPQQGLADVGPVIVAQSLLGDGHVTPDLLLQHLLHVLRGKTVGKGHDALHRQAAAVCETAGALGDLPLQQYLTAPPDGYHVGVVAHKAHLSAVRAVKNRHLNVEDIGRVGVAYLHRHDLQEGRDGGALRLRHAGEHLQLGLGVSGHNARRRSCRDAPQPAGMGDYHAFDVLDDVAADLHQHPIRQRTQHAAGLGGGVSDGDGLGAAGGGAQLLPEDLHILPVVRIVSFHTIPPALFRPSYHIPVGKSIFVHE